VIPPVVPEALADEKTIEVMVNPYSGLLRPANGAFECYFSDAA